MYFQITAEQLDQLLFRKVMAINPAYGNTQNLFATLYNTGIRVNELFNVKLWHVYDANNFMLDTSKSSDIRIFAKSLIVPALRQFYENKIEITPDTIHTLNYDFRRFMPKVYFGPSKVAHWQHSFRYNYIMRMAQIYTTPQALKEHIGHKKLASTLHYLNAAIYIDDIALYQSL
jgi:site-specific recombinase XerC